MARNVNQLFIKGHENPWAEVKTDNNSMTVLVHDLDHPDMEPMYIIIPTSGMAQQLADAGFTRESLARYIADRKAIPWEEFDEETQGKIREIAEQEIMPGLTLENCQPGGKIPVMNSNRLAIFVAGHMSGQTLGLKCMGSYGGRFARVEGLNPCDPPFHIKKITGATKTKAGR